MDFRLPPLTQTRTVTLAHWLKQAGEKIVAHEKLLEVYSADFDWDIPAPCDGTLQTIHMQVGAPVSAGEVLAIIMADNAESTSPTEQSKPTNSPIRPRISPLAARMAAAYHLDVSRTQGTGSGGRITKSDVLTLINRSPAPTTSDERPATSDPLRATLFSEIDLTQVLAHCATHQTTWQKREGFTLTPLPFIVLAIANTLKTAPSINRVDTPAGIGIHPACHLIVANRLITHADSYNVLGLARRLQSPSVMPVPVAQGFVVQARGWLADATTAHPLLYTTTLTPTETASLTLGAICQRVVVVNDALAIRPMLYVGLTFAVQAVGEAQAEKFLLSLQQNLEVVLKA